MRLNVSDSATSENIFCPGLHSLSSGDGSDLFRVPRFVSVPLQFHKSEFPIKLTFFFFCCSFFVFFFTSFCYQELYRCHFEGVVILRICSAKKINK